MLKQSKNLNQNRNEYLLGNFRLANYEKENNFIYHERIPSKENLPDIQDCVSVIYLTIL